MRSMTPLVFAGAFVVLSLAMLYATVRYLAADGQRWVFLYGGLWIASCATLGAFASHLHPVLAGVLAAWLIAHWVILRYGPTLRRDGFLPFAIRTGRGLLTLAVVLLVIGIGEALPFLHDFDAALEPRRAKLQIVFGVLLATGFVLFMAGVIHLAVTSRSTRDGAFTFAEVRRAWHEGTWWDTMRMRRFFVIAGGVALAILAGAALVIVTATPGIKLLVATAVGYAIVRTIGGARYGKSDPGLS